MDLIKVDKLVIMNDADRCHAKAIQNFVNLKLSYRFTAALLTTCEGDPLRLRFLFSKPSDAAPEPAIVVWMDVDVLSLEGSVWTYALHFEGQKYRRVINLDESNPQSATFNETLIDKIFFQKHQLRGNRLWEECAPTASA